MTASRSRISSAVLACFLRRSQRVPELWSITRTPCFERMSLGRTFDISVLTYEGMLAKRMFCAYVRLSAFSVS